MADENPREIKRRIRSVKAACGITHAMKTVSSIKLMKRRGLLEPARSYYEALKKIWLIATDAAQEEALAPKSPLRKDGYETIYVLFTSNKGLVGSFNEDVIRLAFEHYTRSKRTGLIILGNKGREATLSRNFTLEKSVPMPDRPDTDLARRLGCLLANEWWHADSRSYLVYNRFYSALRRKPVLMQCLPPQNNERNRRFSQTSRRILWEPSESKTLSRLLPRLASAGVYLAMVESRISELAARVSAMDSATDKAEDLLEELTRLYNRARKEHITRELVESAGRGVPAL